MNRFRTMVAAIGVVLGLSLGMPIRASAQDLAVQVGVSVRPDTVRIGDPFTVTVTVHAPAGATIEFPVADDTTAPVQAIASRTVAAGMAVYHMAAWKLDMQPVLTGDVIVRRGSAERRISLKGYPVFVASVLPADTALRVAKPARALFEARMIPWWVWALLAAAAIIAWRLWHWWHHRVRETVKESLNAHQRAVGEFARIEALGLVEAGERGRYVALTVEVLRSYLAEQFPFAPLSTTSTELLAATRDQRTVLQERLLRVLNEADLIKFAHRAVGPERARELGKEARYLVDHEHRVSQSARDTGQSAVVSQSGVAA